MKTLLTIFSQTLILLFSAVSMAQTVSPTQENTGFVVFNTDNFYVENNSINIKNGFAIVLNKNQNPEVMALIVPKAEKTLETITENKTIIVLNKPVISHKITTTPVITTKNKQEIVCNPFANNPYNKSLLNAVNYNSIGVVPSNTNTKQFHKVCNLISVCHFDKREIAFQYSKTLFQTSETIILSSNYSKTSRVRPPPFI